MSRFQIYLDVTGHYRWRLIARNGEKVAASEAYASKSNARRSAERVKILASDAFIEE